MIEPQDPHAQFAQALAEATADHDGPERSGLDKGLLRLAVSSARQAGARAVGSGRWATDIALDVAGHLPVRDLAALRRHHDGLSGSLLAEALIRNAGRSTAAVGAATGALASASEVTPATWVALPVELAAETLVVVAIEMKMVGELHEAAGRPLPLGFRIKGPLIAKAWIDGRGIDSRDMLNLVRATEPGILGGAAADLLGRSARDQLTNQLKRRLVRRSGRNLATFAPLLMGAAAGAALNRRATRKLGTRIATSLGIPPPR